jgi:hypothetical protein
VQLLSGASSRAPVGNDRPALNGQLSAGKTKVIEEFIAASGEAVRELSTGHRLAHILTSIPRASGTETARDTQVREQSTAYNYKWPGVGGHLVGVAGFEPATPSPPD